MLELEPQSYGENGIENGGNRQAAADLMHSLQQQQLLQRQQEQQQNAPPPPQQPPNRLPSALKSSNPNSNAASSGPQIQNGNFYVPRGTVSTENNPVPKHIERQHVRRPSVGFVNDTAGSSSNQRAVQEETSSVGTDEGEASETSPVDEAALAQHNELGNRLSHMSNLLKGFGAPVQPPTTTTPARVGSAVGTSRPASVYRAPVPLAAQEQRPEPQNVSVGALAVPPPPRLPSAVVPSKWASRVNNNNSNNLGDSRSSLSIDTTGASTPGARVSPMALSAASPMPGSANSNPSALNTPGSARSGPVSAAVFLNSLKKPSAPVPANAQNMVGSAGPVHRFSSQGGFSPRPESNN